MKPRGTIKSIGTPVRVVQLEHGHDMPLPAYQTDGAAGLDLMAAVPASSPLLLEPGAWMLVPTGLAFEIPPGFEAQVRPRSGLAMRHGVTVLNSPGTIDSDYRGEVKVLLINHGKEAFEIAREDRIAQLVLAPVTRANLVETVELQISQRGAGGFGSTGAKGARKKSPNARSAKTKTPAKTKAKAKPKVKGGATAKARKNSPARKTARKAGGETAEKPANRGTRGTVKKLIKGRSGSAASTQRKRISRKARP